MGTKIIGIISLLLLPFSATLWYKSVYSQQHQRFDITHYQSMRVYLHDGFCSLRLLTMPTRVAGKSEFFDELQYDPRPRKQSFFFVTRKNGPYRVTWLVFPLWVSTSFLALLGTLPLAHGPVQKWRRKRNGLCLECGYNLEGNRSGRCPECGVKFRKTSTHPRPNPA